MEEKKTSTPKLNQNLSSHEPVHSHNCVVQQGFHITTTWRESGKCSDLQTCKHGHDFNTQGMSPFSNASHTSCTQWVTATTGHCYLITNKRDVPSVRFQKFPAKQTAISASQTLALLSTGGADFVPGFTHISPSNLISHSVDRQVRDREITLKQLRWENKRETERLAAGTACWLFMALYSRWKQRDSWLYGAR